jgi:hypothetical protein
MINPKHYSRWKIEPITFIRANDLDAIRANIIKYIMRYDAKDGLKDLDKAQQYLTWLREDYIDSLPEEEVKAVRHTPRWPGTVTYPITVAPVGKLDPYKINPMTEEDLIKAERALYEWQG